MRCRWIATPLAVSAGIKQRVHLKAEDKPSLELFYTTQSKSPAQVTLHSEHRVTHFNWVNSWASHVLDQKINGNLTKCCSLNFSRQFVGVSFQ